METSIRLVLATVVFAIGYLWIYRVPFLLFPTAPQSQLGPLALAVAVAIASLVWVRSAHASSTLIASVLRWAAVAYAIGFVVAVLSGPALFPTKPNQGLVLGLYFTGPAAAVLAGVIAFVVRSKRAAFGPA